MDPDDSAADAYPPPGHLLRRLELTIIPLGDGAAAVELPVLAPLLHPDGSLRTGVLATAIDVAGGVVAARAVHPDWIATSGLSLDSRRGLTAGPARVEARVLRTGRTAVVIGHEVRDRLGVVAEGAMTFTRLARRDGNPAIEAVSDQRQPTRFPSEAAGDQRSLLDALAVRVEPAAAAAEVDLTDRVRNSLGSLQGGVIGLLAELAAEAAGAHALGVGQARTVDLSIDYVAVATAGPVRATAEVVRVAGGSARCRALVVDIGAGGRLAAVASATVELAGSRPAPGPVADTPGR